MEQRFDLLLVNGRIVTETEEFVGCLGVADGTISYVGRERPDGAAREEVDCEQRWVLPGGVDAHVHVGISFGETETSEGWAECSRAALAGGTTTIVDFAIPRPGEDPVDAFLDRLAAATEHCVSDFSLHGCYTQEHVDALDRVGELIELGTRTIKVYTTYRDKLMASDATIAQIMRALREVDGVVYVHAEDDDLVTQRTSELGREGPVPFHLITEARPVEAETIATRRIIDLARTEGTACYFVHQASPDAVESVRSARDGGAHVYSEVCPHYLLLDDSRYRHLHGSRYTCCPPLRSPEVRERLMQLVMDGVADVIASDHCAFQDRHKSPNENDLDHMPFGMPGVQTRVPIVLSALYADRGLAMADVVRYLSTRPAQLNGLYQWQECTGADDYTEYSWHAPTVRFFTAKPHLKQLGSDLMHWANNAFIGRPEAIDPTWVRGAQTIAATAVQLIEDPHLLATTRAEFEERRAGADERLREPLLPRDFEAPIELPWPEYVQTARGLEWTLPTTEYFGEPL